jgi:protein-S-isoprenylcysteine O-methyltransferase Ste14
MEDGSGEHPWGDAGQLVALTVFGAVWIADSFIFNHSTFLADSIPLSCRLIVLTLALGLAGALGWSGHAAVRHGQPPDRVLEAGAFRFVRHPLYLANLTVYAGMTIATLSLCALGVLGGIFAFHDHIATHEERILEARFGEAYGAYRHRTGKWIPKLRRETPSS